MSGLVSGLQNRVRRFESARNLKKKKKFLLEISSFAFILPILMHSQLSALVKKCVQVKIRNYRNSPIEVK